MVGVALERLAVGSVAGWGSNGLAGMSAAVEDRSALSVLVVIDGAAEAASPALVGSGHQHDGAQVDQRLVERLGQGQRWGRCRVNDSWAG